MQTGEQWQQVKALFEAALDQTWTAREAFVRASGADTAIQEEVLSLLAHEHLLQEATVDAFLASAAADEPGPLLPAGERLGAWEIVGPLGAGGMAEVMLARRADGAWDGQAAVKVLKRGMDSAAVLARFALEQRALARLNHPHIAHLLDAGRSASGLPYFVMERVQGRPIDQACEGLALEARLGLFLQLADAVAFAHRQLLVHRDLKPSNVLVTDDGQVKLLDFGIAKALDPAEGEHTGAGPRPYTPNYASPEQVRGEPVGTLTDIYSLGVLLYVMLTGLRPYGRDATTPQEAARSVLEEEPTRPSALSPGLVADPNWLATRKRLRGDLDNILLKALDKAAERRYTSVDALSADIRAHLAGFPVSARAPSAGYLLSRFVRRHRAASAAAALAVLSLVVGVGVASWQAHEADRQRARAEARFAQLRQLANQLVFKYHDQIELLPGAAKVRAGLLSDAEAFMDSLRGDAGIDPALAEELAGTYYRISRLQGLDLSTNLGDTPAAEASLTKALALLPLYTERPDASIVALSNAVNIHIAHGELWQRRGQLQRAQAALLAGQPLLDRALAQAPRDTWSLAAAISYHGVMARILGNSLVFPGLGRWRAACDSAERAREAAETTLREDPRNIYAPDSLAFTLGEVAHCRLTAGQPDQAAALFEQQIVLRDQMAAKMPDDMDFRYQRAISRGQLGRVRALQGRYPEGLALLAEARRLLEAAMQADPGNVAGQPRLESLMLFRAEALCRASDRPAARAAVKDLLPLLARAPSDDAGARFRRVEALLWASRCGEDPSGALAQQALDLLQRDDDSQTRVWLMAQTWGELAERRQGEPAREAARQALRLWQAGEGADGVPPLLRPWADAARKLSGAAP